MKLFQQIALTVGCAIISGFTGCVGVSPVQTPGAVVFDAKSPIPQSSNKTGDSENFHRIGETPGADYAQPQKKEIVEPTPMEISTPAAPVLSLLEGRFGAIQLGMTEVDVRKALAEIGYPKPFEMPFSRDGKLVGISGINFRFTGDGVMFQIYALHESIAVESGLRLNHSTFSEFDAVLGNDLKSEMKSNGNKCYQVPDSDLEVLLVPAKDDPDRVFSVMLTKKPLD